MSIEFEPKSLFMDENGFLFHRGPQKTGNVALIKSPGLAEEIYSKLEFDSDGNLEYYEDITIENNETRQNIEILKQYDLFGHHVEPEL